MKKLSLKDVLDQEADKFIKNSKQRVPEILESALLSLLGLEKRYDNKYEIDHCNNRNSVLIDAFKRLATKEAEKLAKSYKPSKADEANFLVAFEKEYRNQMSYVIRDMARDKVKADVENAVSKIKIDIEAMLSESINK